MPGHSHVAVQEVVKILLQLKKDKWITINKDLNEEALASVILHKITEMPYYKMNSFLKALTG